MSTLSIRPVKLVDKFTYLGSNISSTENGVNIHVVEVLTAIDHMDVWSVR